MNDFPPPPYKVELLQAAQAEIRRCLTKAQRLGVLGDYVATIRRIYDHLATAPHTWGEASRHYRAAKLVRRKMIHNRILVVYAVHEERPLVFVEECRPVLGHPLESA